MTRVFLLGAIALVAAVASGFGQPAGAHHKDNGHSGMLWPSADGYEMNPRTTNGQTIPLRLVTFSGIWSSMLQMSVNQWNSGIQPESGFPVFEFNNDLAGYFDVKASLVAGEANECDDQNSHGCIKNWHPETPSGLIFMHGPFLTAGRHKQSDLMHEMGHALLNANEHYPTYNCTSIMGHSSAEASGSAGQCGGGTVAETLIAVQSHDRSDYRDIYGVEDNQNAVSVAIGFGSLVHSFEGGYQGGNGRAVHQEFENVIDKSVNNIGGAYSFYAASGRKVDNSDNTSPETHSVGGFPPTSEEWCFKIHGHSKAVTAGSSGEWGPFSKRYCVNRSGGGTGVFVTSARNNNITFKVYNFTGSQIVNVQLRTNPEPGSLICGPWTINDGQTATCTWNGSGVGFLDLWYNNSFFRQDTIGYDQ